MPAQISEDYKKCETDEDARISLMDNHPEWYIRYLQSSLTTEQMAEPAPMIAHADSMNEYINRFLLPTLHKLKSENKLKPSGLNQTVNMFGLNYRYTGDVMDGAPTGWGIAKFDEWKYIGTFLNGKAEGILILIEPSYWLL